MKLPAVPGGAAMPGGGPYPPYAGAPGGWPYPEFVVSDEIMGSK
jgi:hypothetical protein